MRIGQVAHRYLPSIGGIENYVYRLARDLSQGGHSVEIFTTTPDPSQTPAGVGVHSVNAILPGSTNPIPIGLFKLLRATKCLIGGPGVQGFGNRTSNPCLCRNSASQSKPSLHLSRPRDRCFGFAFETKFSFERSGRNQRNWNRD